MVKSFGDALEERASELIKAAAKKEPEICRRPTVVIAKVRLNTLVALTKRKEKLECP